MLAFPREQEMRDLFPLNNNINIDEISVRLTCLLTRKEAGKIYNVYNRKFVMTKYFFHSYANASQGVISGYYTSAKIKNKIKPLLFNSCNLFSL